MRGGKGAEAGRLLSSRVRLRLLGGFEVWDTDRQVGGFESQKVRALLSYLACHRGRGLSRDHLAGLLWPDKGPDAARHALRQSLYNLKSRLPASGSGGPLLAASHSEVRFDPRGEHWLDVEAFEEALRLGTARDATDPHRLATAAQLYRGELLAGFFVRGCPQFEDWLTAEQERLRESAGVALRTLIDSYRRRGEVRFGLHYARRLVAIDPLSEEAHRELMRLSALAGQRGRALAQYQELHGILQAELGIEPSEDTRALYRAILADSRQEVAAPVEDAEPIGPLVPLVGRGPALAALKEHWRRALAGRAQLTLVEGESGTGKTRLVKSFLDAATARQRSTVLKGRSYELGPRIAYLPWIEVLRNVLAEEEAGERALAAAPLPVLAEVARLLPELRELRHDLPELPAIADEAGRERLFESVARFLSGLCGVAERGPARAHAEPLVLFLDDLHLADRASLDLLVFLAARLCDGPVWFVMTCRGDVAADLLPEIPEAELARVPLGRLAPGDVEEIAASLVGEGQATQLARFLQERADGLPLAVAELINFLWDEGALAAAGGLGWSLARPPGEVPLPAPGERGHLSVDDLALLRVRRLPNSTRRLVALAAVAGQSVEAELLQHAAEEHGAVVEVGLEVLLKRWLFRRFAPAWTTRRRERDIVLWARGARGGSFEFAHQRIRAAVYRDLDPLRRQAMHAQVAAALEARRGQAPGGGCEALAHHHAAAGQWRQALAHLEEAAERARVLRAEGAALHYYDQALAAAATLAGAAREPAEAEGWRRERARIEQRRGGLAGALLAGG